jgi:hypothetical protein
VLNELNNRNLAFPLNDLTPSVLSNLVPKFRLYKTYKDGKSKEFKFDDFTDIGTLGKSLTLTSKDSKKNILSMKVNKPVVAGFKSFTWEDLATNPANQGLSFKANLVLTFSSMQALFRESENGLRFADLLNLPASGKAKTNESYDMANNRIRADVGWSIPSSATLNNMNLTAEQKEKLYKAIEASQRSFYLNLTSHDLTINEDGVIELSISYVAALDASLISPASDLFYLGEEQNQASRELKRIIKIKKDRIESLKEEKRKINDDPNRGFLDSIFDKITDSPLDEELEIQTRDIERLQSELEAEQDTQLFKKYESLIKSILEKNRLFFVDLNPTQMEVYRSLNKLYNNKSLKPRELQKRRKEIIDKARRNLGFSDKKSIVPVIGGQNTTTGTNIASELKDASKKKRKKIIDKAQRSLDEAKQAEKKRINYVYLGDLLEAAFEIVRNNAKEEDPNFVFRYMVGTMKIYDPNKDHFVNVNIADFPISWDYFQSFFLEKVIKPNKEKYGIRNFISDVISDLLINALSPLCFGKMTIKGRTKINMTSLTLPSHGNPCAPIEAGGKILTSVKNLVKWDKTDKHNNYLFIYPMGGMNSRWSGDYEKDQRNGIMHLQIGSDRGLLKSVSFSKQDIPGQTETNIQRIVDGGGEVGNLLFSNKYNASLTLFGSNIFSVGTHVYLDPTGLGIGSLRSKQSFALEMGIGGYYNITKVENKIEAGVFETSISTVITGLGTDDERKEKPPTDQFIVPASNKTTNDLLEPNQSTPSIGSVPADKFKGCK